MEGIISHILIVDDQPYLKELFSEELVEGRTPTKRNTGQLPTVRTQGRGAVSSRLAGVRQAAQRERFDAKYSR